MKTAIPEERYRVRQEKARAGGQEPYYYLHHLFTELPKATSLADIEALLLFNLKPDQISRSPP